MANTTVNTGNSNPANCREEKSTKSSLIGTISNGSMVNAVRCDGTWATLQYNGTPCFMQHRMLMGIPTTKGDGLSTTNNGAKLNANYVNVRIGPGVNYNTTGSQLNRGTIVTIYDKSYNSSEGYYWYRINLTSATPGRWVRGDYLAPNSSGSSGGSSTLPWPISTDTSSGYTGSVAIQNAWKYSQPSKDADHLTYFPAGTVLNVYGSNSDEFFFVSHECYVLRAIVDVSYCNKAPEIFFRNQNLSTGSYGWDVFNLQHFLNRYLRDKDYASIDVDGNYGPATKAAVEKFQRSMNSQYDAHLAVDGVAGPETQKWLVTFVQNECN